MKAIANVGQYFSDGANYFAVSGMKALSEKVLKHKSSSDLKADEAFFLLQNESGCLLAPVSCYIHLPCLIFTGRYVSVRNSKEIEERA